ncbi:MAG: imidazolonepropionase [Waddliaceae bacterium]
MKGKLIGPITQIVTMDELPKEGLINDNSLAIIANGGMIVENGLISAIGAYQDLELSDVDKVKIPSPTVALPGLIDAHTHICYAGSRAADYALRVSGVSYQEISSRGGGILDTVRKTREASQEELVRLMEPRLNQLLCLGITTCEVKSGYGLAVEDEMKMLRAIDDASKRQPIDLVPTCLAAHTKPWEFASPQEYLNYLIRELFPILKTHRIDIFVEEGAFSVEEAKGYLTAAKEAGFSLCIHANQFTAGGASLAAELQAISAEHLEHLDQKECLKLKDAGVIAVVLPGASLGLGVPMAPARRMLDSGLSVVIASDWNPGSAPMGNLLAQAALLGASEKLSIAETLAGITCRAAHALELNDRGTLKPGMRADFVLFPCDNYQDILYNQGSLHPSRVFIKGELVRASRIN